MTDAVIDTPDTPAASPVEPVEQAAQEQPESGAAWRLPFGARPVYRMHRLHLEFVLLDAHRGEPDRAARAKVRERVAQLMSEYVDAGLLARLEALAARHRDAKALADLAQEEKDRILRACQVEREELERDLPEDIGARLLALQQREQAARDEEARATVSLAPIGKAFEALKGEVAEARREAMQKTKKALREEIAANYSATILRITGGKHLDDIAEALCLQSEALNEFNYRLPGDRQ